MGRSKGREDERWRRGEGKRRFGEEGGGGREVGRRRGEEEIRGEGEEGRRRGAEKEGRKRRLRRG